LPDKGVLLEELQSDALGRHSSIKGAPELQGVYGQIAKGILEKSLDTPATKFIIPDAKRIAAERPGASLKFFQDIYDTQLFEQLYKPMIRAGVPIKADNGFNTIQLDEATKEILRNNPEVLGMKKGGLVQMRGR
jgi:hypothetical protein